MQRVCGQRHRILIMGGVDVGRGGLGCPLLLMLEPLSSAGVPECIDGSPENSHCSRQDTRLF